MPKQIVDAMLMQQQELERVKAIYFVNMNNQLDAIEKYRLAILDNHEEQYTAKYCKTLGEKTEDGVITSLGRIWQKVKEVYGERDIKRLGLNQFGGCFNNRKMRQGQATFARTEYDEWWNIGEEEGWVSLGRTIYFDWMHVQAARIF